MSHTILKAEAVNKQYRLGVIGTGTISNDLKRWWFKIRGKQDPFLLISETNDRSTKSTSDYVWALQNINFEVKKGEVLGIIGKNGAGKSTLLKILSRVTAPTTGEIKTKGRIASLLEVGTGFHPEMTGRENIYLNGAILGMTKAEIKQKEDEIIAFSGCERYIDTPVKRYSSGMRVRLAFAVAAHLEPDILVIDEVLAVGDAEFQKKAIGKMQDISQGQGRTVLFVSHNMAAVKSLCTRAIVLENGQIIFEGDTELAIKAYLSVGDFNKKSENQVVFKLQAFKALPFRISSIEIKGRHKTIEEPINRLDEIVINTTIIKLDSKAIFVVYRFKDNQGNFIFVTSSKDGAIALDKIGSFNLRMLLPSHFFNEGSMSIDMMVTNGKKILFLEEDIITLTVIQEAQELGLWMGKTKGVLKPKFNWLIDENVS